MWPDFADMRKSLAVYFDKVAKTHNEPKVNEWAPTLEHLNKKLRDRRAAIDRQRQVKLPDSLPDEDEQAVERLFKTPGVISKCAREQVTNSDIRRLLPRSWLNDEIINFYGAMLNERSDKRDAKDPRSKLLNAYYLSTFFWAKLVKDGYEKGRLSKWTKKVDIFSKDVILIPVNHRNQHWTAAAINFKAKRFESYDSLNMAGEEVCERLREYVAAEHLNKKKKPFDFTGWKSHVAEDTPQQENGYDCGVFTCQALESLSRGEDKFIFSQKDMMYLRRRMVWEIGHAQLRQDA
ncbi:cysteine proteinase [Coprinopsis marcescibilis]|uniref:Cysteine proteinase n=1 Tax=Coprinopsis marcescibilis TaxID=230819 RepID=A0A5C3KJA8_COPMA|nr:cysteine proteinase [Coprinopsis marcescibilis]